MERLLIVLACCALWGTTYGDQHIPIKKAPYKVLIVSSKNHSLAIGAGAILTEHWAITTATCIKAHRGKPGSLMVRSGSGIYNSNGGLHYVKKVVVHPDFGKQGGRVIGEGDVALLRLIYAFHLSLTVAPIPVPRHVTPAGTTSHIVSWPLIGGKRSPVLNALTVTIVDWVECKKAYQKAGVTLGETTVCTSPVQQAQEGDPLVTSGTLTGLYRYPSLKSLPPSYVDISSFVPWIQGNLDNQVKIQSDQKKKKR